LASTDRSCRPHPNSSRRAASPGVAQGDQCATPGHLCNGHTLSEPTGYPTNADGRVRHHAIAIDRVLHQPGIWNGRRNAGPSSCDQFGSYTVLHGVRGGLPQYLTNNRGLAPSNPGRTRGLTQKRRAACQMVGRRRGTNYPGPHSTAKPPIVWRWQPNPRSTPRPPLALCAR